MKRIRLDRWANQLQPPRNPRLQLQQRCAFSSHDTSSEPRRQLEQHRFPVQHQWQHRRRHVASRRKVSNVATALEVETNGETSAVEQQAFEDYKEQGRQLLNAPSHRRAQHSAKLAALHARLSLPSKLPLQTLARCLVDESVDSRPGYNNAPLALLGQDLLGYYTAEWLLCHYPRLPMPVLFAAQYAYVGSATLAAMRLEWGVEVVAAPGPEVDPGLLQLTRMRAGNAMADGEQMRIKDMPQAKRVGTGRQNEERDFRRGISSRIVFDDEFGDLQTGLPSPDAKPYPGARISTSTPMDDIEQAEASSVSSTDLHILSEVSPTTVEVASASFIRALAGALYLHAGNAASKSFHENHFLSRHLPLHTLFHFTHPTRDLSFLCKREGFEPPIARLISETGRLSRTPVFVVGVYSGDDKLGEAAGSSLDEGRVRAAAAALRSWYLYTPPESELVLPSEVEDGNGREKWKPQLVDIGEIVT